MNKHEYFCSFGLSLYSELGFFFSRKGARDAYLIVIHPIKKKNKETEK